MKQEKALAFEAAFGSYLKSNHADLLARVDEKGDLSAADEATLLKAVDGLGLAYVHLIHIPNEGFDSLELVRANWSGPVIENNGLTLEKAQAVLAESKADAVSFGYLFIGNPGLVDRFRDGAPGQLLLQGLAFHAGQHPGVALA